MNNLLDICRLCMTKLCGVAIDCVRSDQVQLCQNIQTLYNLKITKNDKCSTKICPSCYVMVLMSKVHYNKVAQTQFNINSALIVSKDLSPLLRYPTIEMKRGVKRRLFPPEEITNKKLKLTTNAVPGTANTGSVATALPEKMTPIPSAPTILKQKPNTVWNKVDLITPQYNYPSLTQRPQINYSSVFDSTRLDNMISAAFPCANLHKTGDKYANDAASDLNNRMKRHKSTNISVHCPQNDSNNNSANSDKMVTEENDSNNKIYANFISNKPKSDGIYVNRFSENVLNRTIKRLTPASFSILDYLQKIEDLTKEMSQLKLDVLSNVHSKTFFSELIF